MSLILILLLVLLLTGGLGYRTYGPYGGAGISVGSVLVLILILWVAGLLPGPRQP